MQQYNDENEWRAAIAAHCWEAGYRPGHPVISEAAPRPARKCWIVERLFARALATPVIDDVEAEA